MKRLVSCVAIMGVRNEALHIRRAIASYIEQDIDIIVIDNDSTDGTRDICQEYLGRGIILIKNLPWEGKFNLTKQLEEKYKIIQNLSHEWIIHADADEWLLSPFANETLLEGITRNDAYGYNIINFDEFVFIPNLTQDNIPCDYHKKYLHYYYFSPYGKRLMRAWKSKYNFNAIESGGHVIRGEEVRLSPETFILRHYIVLSQEHAIKKYLGREFSTIDIKKGWHGNRLMLNENKLELPRAETLKSLESWDDVKYDRSDPKNYHYWEWK